jgi:hypothetical protein
VFKFSSVSQISLLGVVLSGGSLCGADLAGVVLDDQGKAVAEASITVARSSVDGPLPAAEAYATTTAADGSYSVKGLGPGPFIVCAAVTGRALLDPCEWGTPSVVRVPAGTGTVNTTTQLQLGAMVSIHVDDASLLLSSAVPTGKAQPFLNLGVWPADGHFHFARRASPDATGQNFQLVVAPSIDLAFSVAAQNFVIADSVTKNAIDVDQRININLAPGALYQFHYAATAGASSPAPSIK